MWGPDDDVKWLRSDIQTFWRTQEESEHLFQVYEDEKVLADSLEGFAGSGLLCGDSVIIIANPSHISTLEERLYNQGFDLPYLKTSGKIIFQHARELLGQFLINDHPDEILFNQVTGQLLRKARQTSSKVRAFGEMVSLLWQEGNKTAAIELEKMWSRLCLREKISLYCAYPRSCFEQFSDFLPLCCEHSTIIAGWARPSTEIYFIRNIRE